MVEICEDSNIPTAAYFKNVRGQQAWAVEPQTTNSGFQVQEITTTPVDQLDEPNNFVDDIVLTDGQKDWALPQYSIKDGQRESTLRFSVAFPFVVNVQGKVKVRYMQLFAADSAGQFNYAKGVLISFLAKGGVNVLTNRLPQLTAFSRQGVNFVSALIEQVIDFDQITIPVIQVDIQVFWHVVGGADNGFGYYANMFLEYSKFRILGVLQEGPSRPVARIREPAFFAEEPAHHSAGNKKKKSLLKKLFSFGNKANRK